MTRPDRRGEADEPLRLERTPDAPAGEWRTVSPRVRRLIAPNPSPFTFTGTCTYVVGTTGPVAVIDPGPDDGAHLAALLAGLGGARVSHVVVTHTHRDHSPGARRLATMTGARIVGAAAHRPARALALGEFNPLEGACDLDHRPDEAMQAGDVITGPGWTLEAVPTPGHTMNHVAFALAEERALFSGDHVMGWSTSIVAPPDGAMGPYMASLERLRARDDLRYWPGHGGPIDAPQRFVRALAGHRRQREAGILHRLAAGDRDIAALVAALYDGLAPALKGAAALSTLAHLEDLVERGLVRVEEGEASLFARFRPA